MAHSTILLLREDKLSKRTNEAPICFRITVNRSHIYKVITKVDPKYWDEKHQRIKRSHHNAEGLNLEIKKERAKLDKLVSYTIATHEGSDDVLLYILRRKIHNQYSHDFFEFAEKHLEKIYKQNIGYYRSMRSKLDKLKAFVKKEKLSAGEITLNFLNEYEKYLREVLKNKDSTIKTNMKAISTFLNEMYKANDVDPMSNPFRKYELKVEKEDRTRLTEEELDLIFGQNFKPRSRFYDARQVYCICCYTGLRISDALTLKWKNIKADTIETTTIKTGVKVSVPISDMVRKVLDSRERVLLKSGSVIHPEKYVFNVLKLDYEVADREEIFKAIASTTARINKLLKELAMKYGINKNITTHTGRHTFISSLADKGVGRQIIQNMTGHQSSAAFDNYVNISDGAKQKAISLLNKKEEGGK